ncbi:MAG: HAMP domain-containing histidine kinase, partial [Candidatus Cloacimonadota bacterium]
KSTNRPLKQLVEATRKIAKGDLHYRIPVTRQDEIGELAYSFNNMTESLRKSIEEREQWNQELDKKVKDATKELESAHNACKVSNIRLKEMNEEKSEAVMTVAHELKAPLSSIWTLLKVTLDGYIESPQKRREIIERAEKRTKQLVSLVKNLLDFSRIESGKVEVEMKPLRIDVIIERIVSLLRASAEEKGVDIKFIKPKKSPMVMGNEEYLDRLFTNLVSNAIKYNKPNGSIIVKEESLGENVRVIVTDTGVGIPQSDLPNVFNILYRGRYAKGKESDGVGLGLSIAKRIIELHKGKIRVESEEAKGSSFFVLLPQTLDE